MPKRVEMRIIFEIDDNGKLNVIVKDHNDKVINPETDSKAILEKISRETIISIESNVFYITNTNPECVYQYRDGQWYLICSG